MSTNNNSKNGSGEMFELLVTDPSMDKEMFQEVFQKSSKDCSPP